MTSRPAPQIHSSRNARARASEPTSVPRDVDEDSVLLHPTPQVGVDDVARSVSAGREHEEDIARVRELVRVGQADGAQAVARGEGGFESGVSG
jgi:hypothetical protein